MTNKSLDCGKEIRISAQKLHFIQKSLADIGIGSDPYLESLLANLNPTDEHKQTVVFQDLLTLYTRLSKIDIPAIGLRIGSRISCGDYGLYGCTL